MTNLNEMKSVELKEMAKELGVKNWWLLKKADLITEIEAIIITEIEAFTKNITKKEEPKKEETKKEEPKDKKENTKEEEATEEVNPDELVTLKELIAEAGIKGTKARRLLRNSDIERPYKRWEWHKEDHKTIIKKVKDLLK